jgi:hypothetical protein
VPGAGQVGFITRPKSSRLHGTVNESRAVAASASASASEWHSGWRLECGLAASDPDSEARSSACTWPALRHPRGAEYPPGLETQARGHGATERAAASLRRPASTGSRHPGWQPEGGPLGRRRSPGHGRGGACMPLTLAAWVAAARSIARVEGPADHPRPRRGPGASAPQLHDRGVVSRRAPHTDSLSSTPMGGRAGSQV